MAPDISLGPQAYITVCNLHADTTGDCTLQGRSYAMFCIGDRYTKPMALAKERPKKRRGVPVKNFLPNGSALDTGYKVLYTKKSITTNRKGYRGRPRAKRGQFEPAHAQHHST